LVKQIKVVSVLQLSTTPRRGIGTWVIPPRLLELSARWRWVDSFKPRPLHFQRKSPSYPLDRRLGGPQDRSGRGEEKNSQTLTGLVPSNLTSPTSSSMDLWNFGILPRHCTRNITTV